MHRTYPHSGRLNWKSRRARIVVVGWQCTRLHDHANACDRDVDTWRNRSVHPSLCQTSVLRGRYTTLPCRMVNRIHTLVRAVIQTHSSATRTYARYITAHRLAMHTRAPTPWRCVLRHVHVRRGARPRTRIVRRVRERIFTDRMNGVGVHHG